MKRRFTILPELLCIFVIITGCSGMSNRPANEPAPAAGSAQPETYDTPNYYYLFDDILIPNGMEHVTDDDFTFDTTQFKAGIQNFQGRVVFDDLVNFFQNNMVKDGWRKVSSVRSKKSMLIYEKSNKAAIIELVDGFKAKATVFAIEYKTGVSSTNSRAVNRPGANSVRPAPSSQSKAGYPEKDINN